MARIPCPHDPEFAKLLLEYIKYGLTLHHVTMKGDSLILYIKTPEHIVIKNNESAETLTGNQLALRCKKSIVNDTSDKCIVKRAPYKNEFDEWDEEFGDRALDEYKTLMLGYFNEEDLL